MRSVAGWYVLRFFGVMLCGPVLLGWPRNSEAQTSQDTRALREYASTGQLNVQIQEANGALFFRGASSADEQGSAATGDLELPPLPDITPATETNWAPPDVDAEKLEFDARMACPLEEVLQAAAQRMQELRSCASQGRASNALVANRSAGNAVRTTPPAEEF